ncbi:hypothetical protein ACQP2U_43140 (plasmid) [Nocardia sp. CA-084685]|uniref:hypothetical protein n=1 Tax=Nocardia sp. CA-084685 TaxID=3239970 RepID=UPI003D996421
MPQDTDQPLPQSRARMDPATHESPRRRNELLHNLDDLPKQVFDEVRTTGRSATAHQVSASLDERVLDPAETARALKVIAAMVEDAEQGDRFSADPRALVIHKFRFDMWAAARPFLHQPPEHSAENASTQDVENVVFAAVARPRHLTTTANATPTAGLAVITPEAVAAPQLAIDAGSAQ